VKKNWIIIGTVMGLLVAIALVVKITHPLALKGAASEVPRRGTFDEALKSATALEGQGELLKAQEALKNIITTYASHPRIEEVQKRLEDINMRIIVSAINVPGLTVIHEVKNGDTLSKIGEQYHTTVALIKKENGLSSDVLRLGMPLRIWTGKFSVLVDKSQNILLLQSNADVAKTYRVSTGKNNITPVGNFKIINKLVHPAWTHEGKVIPPDTLQNILGSRWLGFDAPGYGIHGTTQPDSIGKQATAGCVRMFNNDVEELYDLLPIGTEVTIKD
jgi:lipoprotein-anchoring transpeptidase ErfK/SrfK